MRPFVAFDTSTDHIALAVGDLDALGEVLASEDFAARRAANTVLLPALERLLVSAGVDVSQVCAVLCGRGPGSFTGVRIASVSHVSARIVTVCRVRASASAAPCCCAWCSWACCSPRHRWPGPTRRPQ